MSNEIYLYDLLGRQGHCWSPNPWKTRSVLNFKNIPYVTEFVGFHQVQEKIKATGIPPNEPGVSFVDYSIPAIRLPDGTVMMDSKKIAAKLDELYPTPSLQLQTGIQDKVSAAIGKAFGPLAPDFMPKIERTIVHPSDKEFFNASREKMFGAPLSEVEKNRGGEKAWEAAKPGFAELKQVLTENKKDEGPFVLGSTPSYGDLIILSSLVGFRNLGEDFYQKIFAAYDGPELDALLKAGGKWFEKAT